MKFVIARNAAEASVHPKSHWNMHKDWNDSISELRHLSPAKEVRLILGDQLNSQHSWFVEPVSQEVVYVLMEMRQETDYAPHHIQKVVAFFGAMRLFAHQRATSGFRVFYLTLDDARNRQSLTENLDWIRAEVNASKVSWQMPDEYRLDQQLTKWSAHNRTEDLEIEVFDSEHFYTKRSELASFFKGKKTYRLENFYRAMRKKHDVLMTPTGDPEGGSWNYDASNRQKLPKDHMPPLPLTLDRNVEGLVNMIEAAGVKTTGRLDSKRFGWPITRADGLEVLAYFIETLLPHFGDFQDALTTNSWSVYHSRLSFAMNAKLLTPSEVVNAVEQAFHDEPDRIDVSQAEGFIRQILGWREYMRGVYWAHMPNYETLNFFEHKRKLPDWFWTGKTNMACVSHAIEQTMEHAYAHHIQRLMVTGNFALLAGIHPDELDAWYLGVYIDALQWVEITNTRGMSQFADGGIVGSKPYVSSAQYLKKMGHYCKGCQYDPNEKVGEKACPFNALYWDFYDRHRDKLERNPRIGMAYRTWDRMDPEKQRALLETAAMNLNRIEEL